MKTVVFALLSFLFLACGSGHAADNGSASNITIQVSLIALSNDQAMQLISRYDLQGTAADEFKEAVAMVEKKSAESAGNPSVSTSSGQRATSQSDATTLEVEPVKDPAGDNVYLNIDIVHGKKRVATSIIIKSGDVKCIGALDFKSEGKMTTCLVFVRVSLGK
jgi:hypothetical protein